jgi:uncharacterized protein (TIGR03118 family)
MTRQTTLRLLGPLALATTAAVLSGCSTEKSVGEKPHDAGYAQTNLVANWDAYDPLIVEEGLENAWGISLRPAGAGGHFWVTANGSGASYEYVGDVNGEELTQDDLKEVTIPGVDGDEGTPTGTVFNDHGKGFVISQKAGKTTLDGPATFLFATDTGQVTAWTEREEADGIFGRLTWED